MQNSPKSGPNSKQITLNTYRVSQSEKKKPSLNNSDFVKYKKDEIIKNLERALHNKDLEINDIIKLKEKQMEARILYIVEGYEGIMESMKGLINPNAYVSKRAHGRNTSMNETTAESPFVEIGRPSFPSDAYGSINYKK